jgi:CRP-like cAMP-binding protein
MCCSWIVISQTLLFSAGMTPKKRPTKQDLVPILQVFNSFHPIGKGVERFLLKHCYCIDLTKEKYLLRNGEKCDSVYFVKKGLLRGFVKENNKEITTWFALENEMVAALTTFVMQLPAQENIQAIEDCELVALTIADLDRLYIKYPSFNVIGRKVMELYYVLAENRAYICRLHDADRKYELFLQYFSHFANRVKLTYIASFLGITIETLSRVRAKVSSRKKK